MSVIQARFRLIILLLVVGFVSLFAVLIVEAQVYECRTASICAVMKKQVPVFFGPGKGNFTILIGASERGNRFVPKNAPQTARKRRTLVQKGEAETHEKCH